MSKFLYVVGADYKYTPEVCALLNSLDYIGNPHDLLLINYHLPQTLLDQSARLAYKVIVHSVTEEEKEASRGVSEIMCRKRYWFAGEYGKEYDAVCILDADLVWVQRPDQFLEIAAKTGYILGPSKEQNKVYDHEHHQFGGEWLMPQGYYNRKDVCNCPVFIDAKRWEIPLKQSWLWFLEKYPEGNMKCPDMDCMNIAFLKYAGEENILVMSGLSFLGTNEQMLKPYMRVIEDHGLIKSENGIPVYCYHGQYYKDYWRQQQLINRHQCAAGYLKADKHGDVINNLDAQAVGAMNTLHQYFLKMLDWKVQIEKKDYVRG